MKHLAKLAVVLSSLIVGNAYSNEFTTWSTVDDDSDYTMNGKPAFFVGFGKSQTEFFNLNMQCNTFKYSNKNKAFKFEVGDGASISYYAPNITGWSESKFDTYLNLEFVEKDLKNNTVVLNISGKLVNIKDDSYPLFDLEKTTVKFRPEDVKIIKKVCK
ncbi:hypothetical protein RO21_10345 [[Actinobacillus] muris]|uniref:Lipocalin-like domain-containing protein n=1 Tax=Muribacter muris TaxID=67855 RepID=A0A0J5P364_9PAST|nr:hypothetical protein [Muribacter muris]KMK50686.1 hypothetical protein RO21_10345 [[Actinobacillus] muris] [Muribacter muris]